MPSQQSDSATPLSIGSSDCVVALGGNTSLEGRSMRSLVRDRLRGASRTLLWSTQPAEPCLDRPLRELPGRISPPSFVDPPSRRYHDRYRPLTIRRETSELYAILRTYSCVLRLLLQTTQSGDVIRI